VNHDNITNMNGTRAMTTIIEAATGSQRSFLASAPTAVDKYVEYMHRQVEAVLGFKIPRASNDASVFNSMFTDRVAGCLFITAGAVQGAAEERAIPQLVPDCVTYQIFQQIEAPLYPVGYVETKRWRYQQPLSTALSSRMRDAVAGTDFSTYHYSPSSVSHSVAAHRRPSLGWVDCWNSRTIQMAAPYRGADTRLSCPADSAQYNNSFTQTATWAPCNVVQLDDPVILTSPQTFASFCWPRFSYDSKHLWPCSTQPNLLTGFRNLIDRASSVPLWSAAAVETGSVSQPLNIIVKDEPLDLDLPFEFTGYRQPYADDPGEQDAYDKGGGDPTHF